MLWPDLPTSKSTKRHQSHGASQQISHILQVPVAFFLKARHVPGGTEENLNGAPSPAYVSDFLATSDGLSLTKSFMRIKDQKPAGGSLTWSNRLPEKTDRVQRPRLIKPFPPTFSSSLPTS